MIARLIPALLLAACAATSSAEPPAYLRGCWIERRDPETVTMRWFPERERPGAWLGDMHIYAARDGVEALQFRLQSSPRGFFFCPLDPAMPHGPPCRAAFFGAGHVDEDGGGWVEIRAGTERLTIALRDREESHVIFNGARDGCD